jgi:hypothetical protein
MALSKTLLTLAYRPAAGLYGNAADMSAVMNAPNGSFQLRRYTQCGPVRCGKAPQVFNILRCPRAGELVAHGGYSMG